MQFTVKMTENELTEFLKFREAKQTDKSVITDLRYKMDTLANALLKAVGYDVDAPDKDYCIVDESEFKKAVKCAIDWFC